MQSAIKFTRFGLSALYLGDNSYPGQLLQIAQSKILPKLYDKDVLCVLPLITSGALKLLSISLFAHISNFNSLMFFDGFL